MFPAEGIKDKERMLGYLKAEAGKAPAANSPIPIGTASSSAGWPRSAASPKWRARPICKRSSSMRSKRRLENWFTASPGETAPLFYYNATWGALIGSKPSYGSDMPLNDHHFHYGYFIRAAGRGRPARSRVGEKMGAHGHAAHPRHRLAWQD